MVICRNCGHKLARTGRKYVCRNCKAQWTRDAKARVRKGRKRLEKRTKETKL